MGETLATVMRRKIVHILFDEFHSESWSASRQRAQEMQPEDPESSSYAIAAQALADRDFEVQRNIHQPLHDEPLSKVHLLALLHPCDSKWEKTTSREPPRFSPREIRDITDFVSKGGGLIVVSEYEHDKYGDNLNDLLERFGLHIENSTVIDRSHCFHENPTWFFASPTARGSALSHRAQEICFYRAGSCSARGEATLAWQASAEAHPPRAGVIGLSRFGKGRVLLVTDSSLFGDRHIREFDHLQLWLNSIYWIAAPAFQQTAIVVAPSPIRHSKAWLSLQSSVNQLRLLQTSDGAVEPPARPAAARWVAAIVKDVDALRPAFPHQLDYLNQLPIDFENWIQGGFQKPDFGKSLALFNPQRDRRDHIENLVVFPMYTPNASRDVRFESLIFRVPWPSWLADLEKTSYPNEKFVPGHFVDFTEGYRGECAVLFPETVSLQKHATNHFGVIFCDREAKRLQSCAQKAASIVHLEFHPQLECFLGSLALIQDTMALWDLIHDKSHSVGELPFDPFMVRQRSPFWMYGLEELRVDLRSFCEATRLAEEGFPFARHVTYAILLDRIFRFPITGSRIRNYDALGGQLFFSFLHQNDVLAWSENRLTIRWTLLHNAVGNLREKLIDLYHLGAECSKMTFWLAAHDLVSTYVKPNVASQWKKENRGIHDENDPKKWIDLVHPDEFPLGNFHTHLLAQMSADPA